MTTRTVPVAAVDHAEHVIAGGSGPTHETRDGPLRGGLAHQPQRFSKTHVEPVGNHVVPTHGLDEVVLQALGKEQRSRVAQKRRQASQLKFIYRHLSRRPEWADDATFI